MSEILIPRSTYPESVEYTKGLFPEHNHTFPNVRKNPPDSLAWNEVGRPSETPDNLIDEWSYEVGNTAPSMLRTAMLILVGHRQVSAATCHKILAELGYPDEEYGSEFIRDARTSAGVGNKHSPLTFGTQRLALPITSRAGRKGVTTKGNSTYFSANPDTGLLQNMAAGLVSAQLISSLEKLAESEDQDPLELVRAVIGQKAHGTGVLLAGEYLLLDYLLGESSEEVSTTTEIASEISTTMPFDTETLRYYITKFAALGILDYEPPGKTSYIMSPEYREWWNIVSPELSALELGDSVLIGLQKSSDETTTRIDIFRYIANNYQVGDTLTRQEITKYSQDQAQEKGVTATSVDNVLPTLRDSEVVKMVSPGVYQIIRKPVLLVPNDDGIKPMDIKFNLFSDVPELRANTQIHLRIGAVMDEKGEVTYDQAREIIRNAYEENGVELPDDLIQNRLYNLLNGKLDLKENIDQPVYTVSINPQQRSLAESILTALSTSKRHYEHYVYQRRGQEFIRKIFESPYSGEEEPMETKVEKDMHLEILNETERSNRLRAGLIRILVDRIRMEREWI